MNLGEMLLQIELEDEFKVGADKFEDVIIRGSEEPFYFWNTSKNRLIKRFLLSKQSRVDTLCTITLKKNEDKFIPFLRFWKRDTSKSRTASIEESLEETDQNLLVKSSVDTKEAHDNLWELINFLQKSDGLDTPTQEKQENIHENIDLETILQGHEKSEVLSAVKTYLSGKVTEDDIQMLADRKSSLEKFRALLNDKDHIEGERVRIGADGVEAVWQQFFEENPWIFGYGLTLVSCESFRENGLESVTTGHNIFTGGGKRIDALMRTKGFIRSLVFVEIKKHDTDLLMSTQYRKPDVYQVSREVSGAVAQVQKTSHKAVHGIKDLHQQYTPDGDFDFEISTIKPRQIVIAGNLEQLATSGNINTEKMTSFELYRRGQQDVEILTFDEIFARANFIVDSQEHRGSLQ